MPKFLIDVNLPAYFSLWNSDEYIHQFNLNPKAKDKEIWQYAKEQNLIIITKDSDFSNRVLLNSPPKVIHIRIGNKTMKEFYRIINSCWPDVIIMIEAYKMVTVYEDHLEGLN